MSPRRAACSSRRQNRTRANCTRAPRKATDRVSFSTPSMPPIPSRGTWRRRRRRMLLRQRSYTGARRQPRARPQSDRAPTKAIEMPKAALYPTAGTSQLGRTKIGRESRGSRSERGRTPPRCTAQGPEPLLASARRLGARDFEAQTVFPRPRRVTTSRSRPAPIVRRQAKSRLATPERIARHSHQTSQLWRGHARLPARTSSMTVHTPTVIWSAGSLAYAASMCTFAI